MGPADLQEVLSGLPQVYGERVLATWNGNEDAAIFELDNERLGILTVDFITPVVDDAFTYGQIAAANSISDVFAMGGKPIVALNVVCFPTKYLELDVLKQILEGGFERVKTAGAFLVGGHSVQDDEPKYGLVVYGEVMKKKLWRTTGAKQGDKLILTKALGTGIAVTAIKADMIEDDRTRLEAEESMKMLNKLDLTEGLYEGIHAATDVTGFGLAGHLSDMLGENLDCNLHVNELPAITGVKELADMGLVPEGAYRNMAAYEKFIAYPESMSEKDFARS
ncbi:MAG: selenide, water dikinase SelD, partial [Synergistaceae bacterium]|nr:selenide, water dikinase SelD [Synergistaceae bacterium]